MIKFFKKIQFEHKYFQAVKTRKKKNTFDLVVRWLDSNVELKRCCQWFYQWFCCSDGFEARLFFASLQGAKNLTHFTEKIAYTLHYTNFRVTLQFFPNAFWR